MKIIGFIMRNKALVVVLVIALIGLLYLVSWNAPQYSEPDTEGDVGFTQGYDNIGQLGWITFAVLGIAIIGCIILYLLPIPFKPYVLVGWALLFTYILVSDITTNTGLIEYFSGAI